MVFNKLDMILKGVVFYRFIKDKVVGTQEPAVDTENLKLQGNPTGTERTED